MGKSFTVTSIDEVKRLEDIVLNSMEKAANQLQSENNVRSLFFKMKFGGVGFDPLNPERELNLVEQINQSFTYLASFHALEVLFESHAEFSSYTLNLGTTPGSDIESSCGNLAAEVFASVTPTNNQKLNNDIDKVIKTNAKHKYAFFMCPNFEPGRQVNFERDGVKVWALKGANTL